MEKFNTTKVIKHYVKNHVKMILIEIFESFKRCESASYEAYLVENNINN